MRVAVLTVDQRGSRTRRRPGARDARRRSPTSPLLLPFERTAGDEFQGVLDDPAGAGRRSSSGCCARTRWNIGIGIGEVDEPLPDARPRRPRPGVPPRPRGGDRRQDQRPGGCGSSATTRRRARPRAGDHAVAVGGGAGPAHRRGAGRSPTWSTQGLSYDEAGAAARHQPVGGQPARPGRRHRRGRRARELVTELARRPAAARGAAA